MGEHNVETCLRMLKSASSDNEKFAGIMMVTKVVKAEDCDSQMKLAIADAISLKFLARLLRSNSIPEGCPESMFKTIALSILSSLCSDPVVASKPEMKSLVSPLNEIILSPPKNENGAVDMVLLTDCYDCLNGLAGSKEGQLYLIDMNNVASLTEVIVDEITGHERALEILLSLAVCHGNKMWTKCPSASTKLIEFLTVKFSQSTDSSKFEWCTKLSTFISTLEKVRLPEIKEITWLKSLIPSLSADLKNKLGVEQRQCLVRLVSEVVDKCGVHSLLPPLTSDARTVLLVTHLVCIEVRMILENCTWEQIHTQTALLCSCYLLLENIISHMTNDQPMGFEQKQVLQVHSSMVGAFNGIVFFLDEIAAERNNKWVDPVVTATVRVLGAWLAEETTALKKGIYKLLPFLVDLIKFSIHPELANELPEPEPSIENALQECDMMDSQSNSQNQTSPNEIDQPESSEREEPMIDNLSTTNGVQSIKKKSVKFSGIVDSTESPAKEFLSTDVLCFLLPGLCHLSSEESPRKVLLENDVQSLLLQYFSIKWKDLQGNESNVEEIKDTLASLCGVFLNLTVTEPALVVQDQSFSALLKKLYQFLPTIVYQSDNQVLAANFTTLGLMILQHLNNKGEDKEREKFLASCVTFLSQAICTQENKDGGFSFSEADEFASCWVDVVELWHLAIQAMSACCKQCKDVPAVLLKSGWLVNIMKMLTEVKGTCTEDDIESVLLELITSLSTYNPSCRQVIKEKGGLDVARKYKCGELEKLLLQV